MKCIQICWFIESNKYTVNRILWLVKIKTQEKDSYELCYAFFKKEYEMSYEKNFEKVFFSFILFTLTTENIRIVSEIWKKKVANLIMSIDLLC